MLASSCSSVPQVFGCHYKSTYKSWYSIFLSQQINRTNQHQRLYKQPNRAVGNWCSGQWCGLLEEKRIVPVAGPTASNSPAKANRWRATNCHAAEIGDLGHGRIPRNEPPSPSLCRCAGDCSHHNFSYPLSLHVHLATALITISPTHSHFTCTYKLV